MNEDAKLELMIGWIYDRIMDNTTEEVQKDCPVIAFIREARYMIKDKTYEQIDSELGVFFEKGKCPCNKCH